MTCRKCGRDTRTVRRKLRGTDEWFQYCGSCDPLTDETACEHFQGVSEVGP